MRASNEVSRRDFIASTSVLLAASQFGVAEVTENEADKFALNGGNKAVGQTVPKHARWGEPEGEDYVRSVAKAVRMLAKHYAV